MRVPCGIWSVVFVCGFFAGSDFANAELTLVKHWPGGDGACTDTPLRLTFDTPPVLGDHGKIEIVQTKDGKVVDTIDLGSSEFVDRFGDLDGYFLHFVPVKIEGNSATVRLHSHKLNYSESYAVRIESGVFKDAHGKDFNGLGEQSAWRFKTKSPGETYPDKLTVAADGSGDFCTIQGAVDQFAPHRKNPAEIFIRKGTYDESIRIDREKTHVHLTGEDRKQTVIQYLNNNKLNPGWIQRSVLGVEADDFVLENLTVRNTTPYRGSQAEAVYVNGERCILRNADFCSFQDTLNLSGRVYIADCYVEGDVDFMWGYGSGVYENCELRALHDGYYQQSRNAPGVIGYIYLNCKLTAAPEVKKVPLARIEINRFPASHVAFIHCQMGSHIPPAGWVVTGQGDTSQLRFEEFESTDLEGKPLDVSQRNPASKQLTADEAAKWSDAAKVLAGSDGWNPKAR
jgi:pectin methylesterase-like acyl-CoA thioesterase